MKRFVIERDFPGAGQMSAEDLKALSQKSCGVLHEMGAPIQWLESFVTGDKVYCVYVAADPSLIEEHGRIGGFPVTKIAEVAAVIAPETAGPDYVPGK